MTRELFKFLPKFIEEMTVGFIIADDATCKCLHECGMVCIERSLIPTKQKRMKSPLT